MDPGSTSSPEKVQQALALLELTPSFSKEELHRAYEDVLGVWRPDHFVSPALRRRAEAKTRDIHAAFLLLEGAPPAAPAQSEPPPVIDEESEEPVPVSLPEELPEPPLPCETAPRLVTILPGETSLPGTTPPSHAAAGAPAYLSTSPPDVAAFALPPGLKQSSPALAPGQSQGIGRWLGLYWVLSAAFVLSVLYVFHMGLEDGFVHLAFFWGVITLLAWLLSRTPERRKAALVRVGCTVAALASLLMAAIKYDALHYHSPPAQDGNGQSGASAPFQVQFSTEDGGTSTPPSVTAQPVKLPDTALPNGVALSEKPPAFIPLPGAPTGGGFDQMDLRQVYLAVDGASGKPIVDKTGHWVPFVGPWNRSSTGVLTYAVDSQISRESYPQMTFEVRPVSVSHGELSFIRSKVAEYVSSFWTNHTHPQTDEHQRLVKEVARLKRLAKTEHPDFQQDPQAEYRVIQMAAHNLGIPMADLPITTKEP